MKKNNHKNMIIKSILSFVIIILLIIPLISKGIWTFKTNIGEIHPDYNICPNIYLVGVDLKLP